MKKILILGATGMIGSALFKHLFLSKNFVVFGTSYIFDPELFFRSKNLQTCFVRFDARNEESLSNLLQEIRPDIVINCIGLVKQGLQSSDLKSAIELNALFPHRLNMLCNQGGIRLVHISTDCVFNGSRGNYTESDLADPLDVYGQTKALGEKLDGNSCVIRTSCIGSELHNQKKGLLEWFLAQEGNVLGYSKAIFSGITTLELAKVVSKYFLGDANMAGLWNVSSFAINKFELLSLFRTAYQKDIKITIDEALQVNRTLDSSKFLEFSGYKPPDWLEMLQEMQLFDAVDIEK